ncbi:MAG: ABC transporter permease [Nakamurella sp.]
MMRQTWRFITAGFYFQLRMMRGKPDWFLALITAPLSTAVFLTIFLHAERQDLTAYAVLGPALIALWQMSLVTAGELITFERENGTLEALVAAPARFSAVLFGRILAVCGVSLFAFVESWAVGWAVTGRPESINRPVILAATLLLTVLAMAGWAGVMACVFVLARSARTFQNALSYPFFVLGGVIVPEALLPEWLQWPAKLVFLSWSSDLLRASLSASPATNVSLRLLAIAILGVAGYLLAAVLLERTLRRVRQTGSLAHA